MVERPDPLKHPVRRHVTDDQNVFRRPVRLPEHVCILAPGQNGAGLYDRIGDTFTIAVNYGVTIPAHIDAWIVGDWWGIQKPWFKRADGGYFGQRVFSKGLAERCEKWGDADRWFDFVHRREIKRGYGEERDTLVDLFRPDETSVGIAIDFAYRNGAREIDLIGVDMQGSKYYDGTGSTCESCDRSGVWIFCEMLMDVVNWHQEHGVKFRSLSPSALRVAQCS